MVLKYKRIPKELFEKVFKEGKSLNTPIFRAIFQKNNKENLIRFSFVVPKAVSKKAVIRNKLKRWGFHVNRDLPEPKKPLIYIVFLKKGVEKLDFVTFKKELQSIFSKIQ
jgi:ribonuclease P protein component